MEKRSLLSTPIDLNLGRRRAPPNTLIAKFGAEGVDEEEEAEKKRRKKNALDNPEPPAVNSDAKDDLLQLSEEISSAYCFVC